ncbi:probable glucomannan 4-beta-mannosyltransferase 9 [Oryza brachyantha]|uniref:probable glucomannan 4-beta-mannosyltransferase 9 n=1 Tax=Oryza brachyantha TaxID=4533 RepID=UPI0007769B72|nr:probable glucomannan 4-beta-mannosyltransferase 9 [Oryza brachyantha]
MWEQVKAPVVVPLLRLSVAACLAMSVMLFVEEVYLTTVPVAVHLFGRRPVHRYRCDPLVVDDPELSDTGATFPMVLVQILMYSEREVYKLSIGAACGLSWPRL